MSFQQAEKSSSSGKKELQGPRPAPLKICRDSHRIRKPPLPAVPAMQYRQPVIIYTHSPKVIHTEAGEFMTLVQRLTGRACKTDNNNSSINNRNNTKRMLQIQTMEPPRPDFPAYSLSTEPPGEDFRGHEKPKIAYGNILPGSEESSAGGSMALPALPPWSPNFLIPSPRLLSPNVFQDFPLFTPHSELFHSPRHLMYRPSEPIFTPQRPPAGNAFSSLPSPSPTGFDLFNNFLPDY